MKNKSKKYNKYKKHTLNKHNKTKKNAILFEFNSPSSYAPSINKIRIYKKSKWFNIIFVFL